MSFTISLAPATALPMCIDSSDGATPDHGTLVQSNSTLYGLTTYGGKYGNGTLFSIHTDGIALQNPAELRQARHQRRHQSLRLVAAQRHHALRHDPSRAAARATAPFFKSIPTAPATIEFRTSRAAPRRGQADRRRHPAGQHALRDDRSGRAMRQRRDLRARATSLSDARVIDAG